MFGQNVCVCVRMYVYVSNGGKEKNEEINKDDAELK